MYFNNCNANSTSIPLSQQYEELNLILFQKQLFSYRFICTCTLVSSSCQQSHLEVKLLAFAPAPPLHQPWLHISPEAPEERRQGLCRTNNQLLNSAVRGQWSEEPSRTDKAITIMSDSAPADCQPDLEIISISIGTELLSSGALRSGNASCCCLRFQRAFFQQSNTQRITASD